MTMVRLQLIEARQVTGKAPPKLYVCVYVCVEERDRVALQRHTLKFCITTTKMAIFSVMFCFFLALRLTSIAVEMVAGVVWTPTLSQ
jgi:hypothetical protein